MPDQPHDRRRQECSPAGDWRSARTIEPLRLEGRENVADLIDHVFAASGFNARRLAEGAQLYRRMIEEHATIALTLAGAMTPIGMSGVIISLIERGFIDFIISTGANLYHDLHRPYGFPMCQGHFAVDDNELADAGVARIYDVFVGEDETLMATDRVVLEALRRLDTSVPFSTARYHRALGEMVLADAPAPEKSFVAAAARCDVPIYTSSPGDSSIGMNLIIPHLYEHPVHLNPLLDVIETTAIVRDAELNGVVEVGGGSPKNFYLQTQPTLHQILGDSTKGGHDYFLQLTTDSPQWGGLSGATPGEARSWGKIKDAYRNNVVVYSCASITFPLIAQYVLTRCSPRPLRRLYPRLDDLVKELKSQGDATRSQGPRRISAARRPKKRKKPA
ncbi:MAG: deoxyhypusine synthase [Planctomycetota bacterium]